MLSQPATIETVAAGLDRWKQTNVVLDPVMVAASGDRLLAEAAIDVIKRELFPRALVVTPNLPEAAALLDTSIARTEEEMLAQARRLLGLGAKAVLIKGGHATGPEAIDLLVSPNGVARLVAERVPTDNTHGTGCTLSSAIAAGLAKGQRLGEAVSDAKLYLTEAIRASGDLTIGAGHGPVHHFHAWW